MAVLDVTVIRDHIDYSTRLETESCCSCAVPFAMPQDLKRRAQGDPDIWLFCPNGHRQHYTESEADRLRRQLKHAREASASLSSALTASEDQRKAAQRSAAAYKGQLTRARKRAGAGVCPVTECHRTVKQLADHMKTKHPDYQP